MSQTGVYGTDSRRAARRSGASGSDTQESLSSGPMAYISGKQAFLQILRQEGVSVMFGNPGTTELPLMEDRKSTRLNSSHVSISYAVFCLKKKNQNSE